MTKEDVLGHKESGKALSTPAVRAFAKEKGVDINQVPGTGKEGSVTREDILSYMKGPVSKTIEQKSYRVHDQKNENLYQPKSTDIYRSITYPITGMKKAMTKTMTESLKVPFFGFTDEVDITTLLILRGELKKVHPEITPLAFFVKAASLAMLD